jgi:hypothetical protein
VGTNYYVRILHLPECARPAAVFQVPEAAPRGTVLLAGPVILAGGAAAAAGGGAALMMVPAGAVEEEGARYGAHEEVHHGVVHDQVCGRLVVAGLISYFCSSRRRARVVNESAATVLLFECTCGARGVVVIFVLAYELLLLPLALHLAALLEEPRPRALDVLGRLALLEVRPPVVLDLVVRPTGQAARNRRPPVSPESMELDDDALLLGRDLAALQIRSQIVHPPQPAALATSLQPCSNEVRPK